MTYSGDTALLAMMVRNIRNATMANGNRLRPRFHGRGLGAVWCRNREELLSEQLAEAATEIEASEGIRRLRLDLLRQVTQGGQDQILQQVDIVRVHNRRVEDHLLELEPSGGPYPDGPAAGGTFQHGGGCRFLGL